MDTLKVVTQFTYDPREALEKIDYKLPSITIPDQAYTIQQLLERHQQGILTDVSRTGFYLDTDDPDDPDFSQLDKMDLVDQEEFIQNVNDGVKNARKQDEERSKREAEAQEARKGDSIESVSGGKVMAKSAAVKARRAALPPEESESGDEGA